MRQSYRLAASCVSFALARMRDTPSRPILAACGVMAATTIVVATLCVTDSSFAGLAAGLHRLGASVMFVRPALSTVLQGNTRGLSPEELRATASMPEIATAVPFTSISGSVYGCGKRMIVTIQGAIPEQLALENLRVSSGRFITDLDNDVSNPVVVLGHDVASNLSCLFVDDGLAVSGHHMTVVGVLKPAPDFADQSVNARVFLPMTRAIRRYGWPRGGVSALLKLRDGVDPEAARSAFAALLRRRAGVGSTRDRDFEIHTRDELIRRIDSTRGAAATALFGFLACGVLMTALGVAGTVLSSVLERQAEIGLCRCLGATRARVRIEFLLEGTAIGAAGGICGSLVGAALGRLVSWTADLPPGRWVGYAVLASVVATLFSAAAAAWPATRAATFQPIEALRLER